MNYVPEKSRRQAKQLFDVRVNRLKVTRCIFNSLLTISATFDLQEQLEVINCRLAS